MEFCTTESTPASVCMRFFPAKVLRKSARADTACGFFFSACPWNACWMASRRACMSSPTKPNLSSQSS
eukprot:3556644-Rhodomonas_salina.1